MKSTALSVVWRWEHVCSACPFLSSSDSHERRIYLEELILACTDKSLLLLE